MYNSFILFNYTFLKNKITKSIVKNLHQTTLTHLRGQNRYKNIPIHETSYIRYRIRNVPHIQESKELLQEIQKNECMFLFLEIQKSLDQYSTLQKKHMICYTAHDNIKKKIEKVNIFIIVYNFFSTAYQT